jgi:hypothetical protein
VRWLEGTELSLSLDLAIQLDAKRLDGQGVRILRTVKSHCDCRLQRIVVRPLMDQNEVVGESSPFPAFVIILGMKKLESKRSPKVLTFGDCIHNHIVALKPPRHQRLLVRRVGP